MIQQVFNPDNYILNGYALPMLVVGAAIVALGVFVLIREQRFYIGFLFLLMCLSISLYLIATGLNYASREQNLSLFWIRISQLGSALIPSTVLMLTTARLSLFNRFRFIIAASIVLSIVFVFGIFFTDLFMRGSARFFWGDFVQYGPLGFAFIGFFVSIMVLILRLIWQEYWNSTTEWSTKRNKGLLIAFSCGYLGAIDFLPALGISVYPFGYIPIFFFTIMCAYVVMRYQLVDITPGLAAGEVLETMEGAVIVADLEGRIQVINRVALEMLGFQKSELIGKDLASILPVLSDISTVQAGSHPSGREIVWSGSNGRRFDVIVFVSPLKGHGNIPVGTVYVAHDITGRKQAEVHLKELLSLKRSTLESTADGILVVNSQGKVVDHNSKFIELWNIPSELMEQKDDDRLIQYILSQLKYPEAFVNKVRELYNNPDTVDFDEISFKDGRIYERYSIPHYLEGKSVGRVWSFRDITERKHTEDEKQKLQMQLLQAQKMEAVGQLAGGIAHDFNNILSAIIGYGSILQMKMAADDLLRTNVDQILEAASRAAKLTHSLLAFSRKHVLNMKPIHLNGIIARHEQFLRRIIGEDIEIKSILRGDAVIMADSGQIEQVLMNLATNARDAMPSGGQLTVETTLLDITDAFIGVHGFGTPGAYVVMSVTDTGIGMDEEATQKIFEPFFTTKDVGRGTGLGMAIVYAIVKQHKGYINVYSQVGKGTTFMIYFPIHSEQVEQLEKTITATPVMIGTETILLAEDDAILRTFFKDVFNEYGYTVVTAEDGEDAIRKFTERKDDIQLCVIDVVMPKKNGREVYESIQKIKPGTKVIFSSGYTADKVQLEGLPAGIEFIAKPAPPQDYLNKIREVLDKKAQCIR